MATEIYVLHPAVGQSRSADPASLVTKDETNFAWLEQQFPDGAERQTFFQDMVIPPAIDATKDLTVTATFRQVTAAVSDDALIDILYRAIGDGDNRDSAGLTPIGSAAVTMTGTIGDEKEVSFTLSQAGLTSGDELLLSVMRKGNAVGDDFLGTIALVRLVISFELLPSADALYVNTNPLYDGHGGLPVGWDFPAPGHTIKQMFDLILYPFQTPTIDSFSLTALAPIAGPVPAVLEVGNSIPHYVPPTPLPTSPNTIQWIWTSSDPGGNLKASTTDLDHIGVGNIATNIANAGPQNFPLNAAKDPVQVVTADMPTGVPVVGQNRVQHTFRISMDYERQMTPPPDPKTTFTITRDAIHTWYWMVYAGISANTSLSAAQIKALADYSALTGVVARTYNMSATGYKYICYPTSFVAATSWIDDPSTGGGFAVPFVNLTPVPVTNIYGQTITYHVQRSSFPIVGTIDIIVS